MAIPNSPLTRLEEYLNNIATGEGAIPDVPLTRIEQYLDYIAKNGGSGGGGSGGGSGGGALLLSVETVETTEGIQDVLNKTANELKAAMEAGQICYYAVPAATETFYWYLTSVYISFKGASATFASERNGDMVTTIFEASDADSVLSNGGK